LDLANHSGEYKEYYLLEHNDKQATNHDEHTARRTVLATLLYACFLLGLFFEPEDGIDIFLPKFFKDRNIYFSNKPLSQTMNKYDHLHSY
jgi:hypothetical protein